MEHPPIESPPSIGWGTVIAWTCITGLAWGFSWITGYAALMLLGVFMGTGQMLLLRRCGIIQDDAWIWPAGLFFVWAMMGITLLLLSSGASEPAFIVAVVIMFVLLHEALLKKTTGSYSWGIYPIVSLVSAALALWGVLYLFRSVFPRPHPYAVEFLEFFLLGCVNGAATGIAGFLLLKRRRKLAE